MKKFVISMVKSIIFILVYLGLQGIISNLIIKGYFFKSMHSIDKVNSIEFNKRLIDTIAISLFITIIVTFIILLIFYRFSKKDLLERCRFNKFKVEYLVYILMIAIGFAFINSFIVSLMNRYISSYQETNQVISNMQSTAISMIIINIVGPIFEEILFRGVIFDELLETSPLYVAVIIQGLLFAIAHGNLLQGIYTFILGVILAIINYYCKSI